MSAGGMCSCWTISARMWIGVMSGKESLFVSASQLWLRLLPSPEITFPPHCSSSAALPATGGAAVREIVDPMVHLSHRRETFFKHLRAREKQKIRGMFLWK